MTELLDTLVRWVLRAVLFAAGALFVLSLCAALLVLAAVWGLRALWARLTGRPVAPWVLRVDPMRGWASARRTAEQWTPGRQAGARHRAAPPVDVTDVEAKPPPPAR